MNGGREGYNYVKIKKEEKKKTVIMDMDMDTDMDLEMEITYPLGTTIDPYKTVNSGPIPVCFVTSCNSDFFFGLMR